MDTNVILEAHRTASWRTLASRHRLETVTECVTETQTGALRRSPADRVDETALRASLSAVHDVSPGERAAALLRDAYLSRLDAGEAALWCHALSRPDAWMLCGPDAVSLRLGVRLGFRQRLVALETLLSTIGHRPRVALHRNYTRAWHEERVAMLAVEEGLGPA